MRAAAVGLTVLLMAVGLASGAQFSNTTSISIPSSGAATPYPSTITVSGLAPAQITSVTVTLNNLSHTYPDDIDILLVGPGGQTVLLMSDCGGDPDLVNVNLTFDDAAATSLPDATLITSGTYKPTNYDTTSDAFTSPAPVGPYGTALSVFNGTNPNGTWSLYARDDIGGDSGSIAGGWTLTITTPPTATLSLLAQPGPDPGYPSCYPQGAGALTVDVDLNATLPIVAGELRIAYDTTKLTASSVTVLSPFVQAAPPTIDDPNGLIQVGLYDPAGVGSATGAIVRVVFDVDAAIEPAASGLVYWNLAAATPTSLVDNVSGVYAVALGNLTLNNLGAIQSDNTLPTISGMPANITQAADPGACSAVVTWTPPTAWDLGGIASFTSDYSPGATFPVGTTLVTYTAVDNCGNTATASFSVTVYDNQVPLISPIPVPPPTPTDPGLCTATVSWPIPFFTDNCPGATMTGTHTPPASLPLGNTTVVYTAVDAYGNTSTYSFVITVFDGENPTVTCPANMTVSTDPGVCSAAVSWPAPVGSDNCPGVTVACVPPSGSVFPLGTTTVTCTATDAAGNTGTCTFTVTVVDGENPALAGCPANVGPVSVDPNTCTYTHTWTPPTATDNCGTPVITVVSVPPLVPPITPTTTTAAFPTGLTTVTYTATDGAGNIDTCSFTVDVNDGQAPAFVGCPSNVGPVPVDPNSCGYALTWTPPTATDNCVTPVITVVVTGAGAGLFTDPNTSTATFPTGVTTVTYTADDGAQTATCAFTVSVYDNIFPAIHNCPLNQVVPLPPGAPQCGTNVNWTHIPSASDNCGVVSFYGTCTYGGFYPVGTTNCSVTAVDAAGNATTCSFSITVQDLTPPQIVTPCPPSPVNINSCGSASYTWTPPTFSDACGPVTVTVVSVPPVVPPLTPTTTTATFPLGVTTVTYTATDAYGNPTTCGFTVNVAGNGTLTVNIQELGLAPTSPTRYVRLKGLPALVDGLYDVAFNAAGVGTLVLSIPCGTTFTCMSVEDELHTLARQIVAVPAIHQSGTFGENWTFNFTGANGLILGDILNDGQVNALDFGMWVLRVNVPYGTGSTPKNPWDPATLPDPPANLLPPYHADLNGDGSAATGDFAFLTGNYGIVGHALCGTAVPREFVAAFTYADLIALGAAEAILADLNRDGVLDADDLAAFSHGVMPPLRGDVDGDGALTFADIDAMVAALSGEAEFYELYPNAFWYTADCNADGSIDFRDIDAFVSLLGR